MGGFIFRVKPPPTTNSRYLLRGTKFKFLVKTKKFLGGVASMGWAVSLILRINSRKGSNARTLTPHVNRSCYEENPGVCVSKLDSQTVSVVRRSTSDKVPRQDSSSLEDQKGVDHCYRVPTLWSDPQIIRFPPLFQVFLPI